MIMNKTAQNLTWNCLPLEVKKEVKRQYQIAINAKEYYTECTLEYLFGHHNLTSDAEGEEMLTVSRKRVQELYNKLFGNPLEPVSKIQLRRDFQDLFGSKCLPDETCNVAGSDVASNVASNEPKPQPKFHKRDRVKVITDCWKGNVYTVLDVKEIYPQFSYKLSCSPDAWFAESTLELYTEEPKPAEPMYHVGEEVKWRAKIVKIDEIIDRGKYFEYIVFTRDGNRYRLMESDLEPYTELKENLNESESAPFESGNPNVNQCQNIENCDKFPNRNLCDKLIRKGFADHNRLHIAAMLAAGMAGTWSDTPQEGSIADKCASLAELSFKIADALIEQSQNQ